MGAIPSHIEAVQRLGDHFLHLLVLALLARRRPSRIASNSPSRASSDHLNGPAGRHGLELARPGLIWRETGPAPALPKATEGRNHDALRVLGGAVGLWSPWTTIDARGGREEPRTHPDKQQRRSEASVHGSSDVIERRAQTLADPPDVILADHEGRRDLESFPEKIPNQ